MEDIQEIIRGYSGCTKNCSPNQEKGATTTEKIKTHNSVKEENHHAGDKCRKAEVPNEFQFARTRARQQEQSWSSTLRSAQSKEEVGNSEDPLHPLFLPPRNSRRRHCYVNTPGMLTEEGNNRLKNSWVRQMYYRGEGWSTFLKSAMKWAKIFSELGRT